MKMKYTLASPCIITFLLIHGYIGLVSAVHSDLGDVHKDVKEDTTPNSDSNKRRSTDYCEQVCREIQRQRRPDNGMSNSGIGLNEGGATARGQENGERRRKQCDNVYENGFQNGFRSGFREATQLFVPEQPAGAYGTRISGTRRRNGEIFPKVPGTRRGQAFGIGSGEMYNKDVMFGQGFGYGSGTDSGYDRGVVIPVPEVMKNEAVGNRRGNDVERSSGSSVVSQHGTGTDHVESIDDTSNRRYANPNVNNVKDKVYITNTADNRRRVVVSQENGFKSGKDISMGQASVRDASGGASVTAFSAKNGSIRGHGIGVVYTGDTGGTSITRDSALDSKSAIKISGNENIYGRGTSVGSESVSGYDKDTSGRGDTTSHNTRVVDQRHGNEERRIYETRNTNIPRNGETFPGINRQNGIKKEPSTVLGHEEANGDSNSGIGYSTGVYLKEGTFRGHGEGIAVVEVSRDANGLKDTGGMAYGYGNGHASGKGIVVGSAHSATSENGKRVSAAKATGLSMKQGSFSGTGGAMVSFQ